MSRSFSLYKYAYKLRSGYTLFLLPLGRPTGRQTDNRVTFNVYLALLMLYYLSLIVIFRKNALILSTFGKNLCKTFNNSAPILKKKLPKLFLVAYMYYKTWLC